jgi:hypothetical protein
MNMPLHPVAELSVRKNDTAKRSVETIAANQAMSARLAYEVEMFLAGTPVVAGHQIGNPSERFEPKPVIKKSPVVAAKVTPMRQTGNTQLVLEVLQSGLIVINGHCVVNHSLCHMTRDSVQASVQVLRRHGHNIVTTRLTRGHAGFELLPEVSK